MAWRQWHWSVSFHSHFFSLEWVFPSLMKPTTRFTSVSLPRSACLSTVCLLSVFLPACLQAFRHTPVANLRAVRAICRIRQTANYYKMRSSNGRPFRLVPWLQAHGNCDRVIHWSNDISDRSRFSLLFLLLLADAIVLFRSTQAHLHVVGMLRFMSDINQPSLPTAFNSVLVSISIFRALSTAFHSINSPDNSLFSHFVLLPVLSLPCWSFQLCSFLWKSPSAEM